MAMTRTDGWNPNRIATGVIMLSDGPDAQPTDSIRVGQRFEVVRTIHHAAYGYAPRNEGAVVKPAGRGRTFNCSWDAVVNLSEPVT